MEKMQGYISQAKSKYEQTDIQGKISTEKVKTMFTGAYSKFNDIVQKQKVNIPQILDSHESKSRLNDYLKKQSSIAQAKEQTQNLADIQVAAESDKHKHFKIGAEDLSAPHNIEAEGEVFSDSEEPIDQLEVSEKD